MPPKLKVRRWYYVYILASLSGTLYVGLTDNLRRRMSLSLVSGGLSSSDAETMHIPIYPSVEVALAEAVARLPASDRKGCVAILPYAGVTLPNLETKDGI